MIRHLVAYVKRIFFQTSMARSIKQDPFQCLALCQRCGPCPAAWKLFFDEIQNDNKLPLIMAFCVDIKLSTWKTGECVLSSQKWDRNLALLLSPH